MKLPYPIDDHDLIIEFYFKDVDALLAISADDDFKALHIECDPYLKLDQTTVTATWIEEYLDDGKLVNISPEGKSLQPSFAELSNIELADKPVSKYY